MALYKLAATVALLVSSASAQNPWVNRRRNKDKEAKPVVTDEASAGDDLTDFARLNSIVEGLQTGGGGDDANPLAGMGAMWDEMMDSPEMAAMLNDPELLKATIKNNPLLSAIPGVGDQVDALLESDTFKDPAQLREAMKVGMEAFKTMGDEFGAELGKQMELMQANPEAFQKNMADALAQLVPGAGADGGAALLEAAKGLFDGSGDVDLDALAKIPGMEALGDPEALKAQMEQMAAAFGGQNPLGDLARPTGEL